jgi:hypothetical protein
MPWPLSFKMNASLMGVHDKELENHHQHLRAALQQFMFRYRYVWRPNIQLDSFGNVRAAGASGNPGRVRRLSIMLFWLENTWTQCYLTYRLVGAQRQRSSLQVAPVMVQKCQKSHKDKHNHTTCIYATVFLLRKQRSVSLNRIKLSQTELCSSWPGGKVVFEFDLNWSRVQTSKVGPEGARNKTTFCRIGPLCTPLTWSGTRRQHSD